MFTSILTDHDDFKKARRALIVSCVTLIILTKLDFQTQIIEFLGLKLGINPRQIVLFGVFGALYFTYIFSIQLQSEWLRFKREWIQEAYKNKAWAKAQSKQAFEEMKVILEAAKDNMDPDLYAKASNTPPSNFKVPGLELFSGAQTPDIKLFFLKEIAPPFFLLGLSVIYAAIFFYF